MKRIGPPEGALALAVGVHLVLVFLVPIALPEAPLRRRETLRVERMVLAGWQGEMAPQAAPLSQPAPQVVGAAPRPQGRSPDERAESRNTTDLNMKPSLVDERRDSVRGPSNTQEVFHGGPITPEKRPVRVQGGSAARPRLETRHEGSGQAAAKTAPAGGRAGGSETGLPGVSACWAKVARILDTRARSGIPRSLRGRVKAGEVVLRFGLAQGGRIVEARIERSSAGARLERVALSFLEPPVGLRCPGEGRWPVRFTP